MFVATEPRTVDITSGKFPVVSETAEVSILGQTLGEYPVLFVAMLIGINGYT